MADIAADASSPPSDVPLIRLPGFLALFVVQFFGAFADNVLKSALGFMVAYRGASLFGLSPQVSVTLSGAVFMLPYFLFSGFSGRLNDAVDKAKVVRWTRVAEVGLALLSGTALLIGSAPLALLGLFLYATQSTLFGPAKYALLPRLVGPDRLIAANALFEGSTFVAVLCGTLFGGLAIGLGGEAVAVAGLIVVAVIGTVAAFLVPPAPPAADAPPLSFSFVETSGAALAAVRRNRTTFLATLGISWFWMVGLIVMSVFPEFARTTLEVDEIVANILVGAFVVGIGAGSAGAAKLLAGRISGRHTPVGALLMAIGMVDLAVAAGHVPGLSAGGPIGAAAFLGHLAGWRVVVDLMLVAFGGGLFTVPLYALLQTRAERHELSAAIAGNNILNAALMVGGTILAAVGLAVGLSTPALLVLLGLANVIVALICLRLMPQEAIKGLGARLLKLLFRARVEGLAHYGEGDGPAVVVANHTSFLDAVLIGCLLPGRPVFAINTHIAKRWWVRPAFLFFDLVPVDPTSPFAIRAMVKRVQAGQRLVIFPEGRITVTGALMKVYDGPALIAALADVPVIPIRIEGAQYSIVSRLKGKVRRRLFPSIRLTVLPPRPMALAEGLVGRRRRAEAGRRLQALMVEMVFATSPIDTPLFDSLVAAAKRAGSRAVLDDIAAAPVGYRRLIAGAFALGRPLAALSRRGERIGLLLPNAIPTVVAFFALQATGRVPAMLNFTAGAAGIAAALAAAEIRTVVTSRRFVEQARLGTLLAALERDARVVYLEDLRDAIGRRARLAAALAARAPLFFARRAGASRDAGDEAVVLFTSGSEGVPKGVSLSHRAIQANRFQASAVIDFGGEDVVLNALPLFHAFGLSIGTLLPLFAGVKTVLYPSPLHYRIVPEIAYGVNATILLGTDTFLTGYARMAHAYDFYSIRYVFAGAERVRPETRRVWSERFGLRILEGYGTTETAPVIAINTPMANRPGSVGRLLPGIEARLAPVDGLAEGGRLMVRGPNVMRGYLRAAAPGVLEPPADGFHDTGDIVTIDSDGFVTIAGRARRFAKVGGEMVSLAAVEAVAAELWPEHGHAALAVPHARKGEEVVLVTERPGTDAETFRRLARTRGLPELAMPRTILTVDALPLLGTGKIDHRALSEQVLAEAAAPAAERA
ncbi:acyl-[ACP]--phospholipid O-acyltransferase [Prosthecomicrobium pneumaticum]|uniref:Acyl-[acyl-carrier-protein]-phospholipid O-acyltransferase/long-chain-fatty-acid--[acyl-carrier-protein] ligase n=1 Tax=Prosthecomicrobium pneumaticum TaxID=81895 RepID=A0A7W9FQR4_9HYPH|nr:acyl-[ACP]--phospholipid O-acyltransferase [Prosthecomicrobium pneumaticum]MBB5755021.1 acyl-[acyl-carrier-protein]-phospholipid O-acyltransferase/long-chain-fatty-acid--[acyl-carrier-protein] ligase [Prosthecomicrobium pneumaticum]